MKKVLKVKNAALSTVSTILLLIGGGVTLPLSMTVH